MIRADVTPSNGPVISSALVQVNIAVPVGTPPTVSVTAPAGGANVAVGAATTITATASDGDGFIPSTTGGGVTFFVDGEPIGTDLTAPYSIAWTPATAKQYSIVAQTVDDKANYVLSSAVTVTAVPLTTASVTLTSPTVGTITSIGSTVALTANPTPSTGATVSAVEFLVGTTVVASATSAPYSRTWTPTAAGAQSITARVTDSNGNTATSSAVTVTVSAAPTVAISTPATGASLPAGTPVTVSANTTAGVGLTVTQVEFFANGTSIVVDNSAPFSVSWTPSAAGTTTLTARVTDSAGAVVTSSGVNVTVTGASASVSLTQPTVGRIVSIGAPVSLAANAAPSPGGTVSVVEFLVGTSVVASTTTAPYTATWTPTTAGAQSLTARVTDNLGSIVTSPAVAITVAAAPTVSITSPVASASLPTGTATTIAANATAGVGLSVAGVEFFVNGTSLGSDTTSPFTFSWTPSVVGTNALTARVTDSAGAVVTSSIVNVTITAATSAPTVSITAPATGAVVSVGANVTISADATPPAGATIAQVQFLVGTTVVGTDTTAPYSINWIPTTAGNFNLTARALDSNNASTTSSAITITAVALPTVAITAPSNNSTVNLGANVAITANPSASAGATVARVEFFAGTTSLGVVAVPPYTVTWTPGTLGATQLTARVTDSAGLSNTSSAINVTVSAGAPTVSLVTPTAGSIVTVGTGVALAANAAASAGATVTQVQFQVNGAIIATVAAPGPYTATWTPTGPGNFNLTARVTDSNGDIVTSTAVPVTAVAATSSGVSLVMNPTATTIALGSARFLTASVVATINVEVVRFYLDGALVGDDRAAPYTLQFTLPADTTVGPHQLQAVVTDTAGATFSSPVTTFTAIAAVGQPPTVGILAPSSGAFLPAGTTVTLSGTAADADGSVSSVQVFADGASLGNATLTGATWALNWTPPVSGPVNLTAIAIDSHSNATRSPAVTVQITDATSPTMTIALSPGPATMPTGATRNVLVTATPTVAGRAIVRVEFFVDGTKVGEDTTAPYSFRYTAPATPGAHSIAARATDNAATARDVSTSVTVINAVGAPPTATLITPASNPNPLPVPGTSVALAGTAVASGGAIASVQFYQNGAPIGNPVTAPPFAISFNPPAPGSYVLDMIATDDRGNTKVSNSFTLIAAFGTPSVSITLPTTVSTARATPNVPFSLTATATAGAGSNILLVEMLVDGVPVLARTAPSTGTTTAGTYGFLWTPDASLLGPHVITVRATDTNSQTVTSLIPLNVNVANLVGTPPSILGVSPANNATLQSLSVVNFQATATFATINAPANNVEFYLNESSIGTGVRQQATNVYRLTYDLSRLDLNALTPLLDGNGNPRYAVPFYVIARDANGNQTVTATSTLNIVPSASFPPTVQLVSLGIGLPNQAVTAGTPFAVGVNATDPDGIVTSVQLFANGAQVATQANPQPGAIIIFTPNSAGALNLSAIATDDTGNTAVSPQLLLNVTGNTAPSAVLVRPTDDSTTTTVNTPVFLEATASDPDIAQLVSVQFINTGTGATLAVGQRVGLTDTYRAIWTPTQANTFIVAARASDSAQGQTTSSVSRRVVVSNVVGIAPVITISVPGATTTASNVNLTATATDSDGSVIGVEFFVNRISIGQATRDQLTNTWRLTAPFAGVPVGAAEVVALARDSSGNVAASPTTTMTVNAAQSIAPSVVISASATNVAFSRQVQLTANARDTDGAITSVQYFANGASVGTSGTAGTNFQVNWTPTQSGTFNIYAVATDTAVNGIANTTVSAPITVTVRRNNPVLDDSAFILQTYSDITNTTNILAATLADLDDQLARGTLTRAQLVTNLTTDPGFEAPVNLLAAYYAIMGEWPTPANYTTLLATARTSLPNAIGAVLSSPRYAFKFNNGTLTSSATLTTSFNGSFSTLTTFASRLWQNAGLPAPSQIQVTQFQNNPTVVTAPPLGPLGRGYAAAGVGLNTAIAEFITITNQNNTALRRKAQAAALYYQLDRPPTPVGVTNDSLIVDPIALRIDELLRLSDLTAIADAVLRDTLYTNRYVTILRHPESLTVNARSGALFRVEAIGAQPLSYQWLLNGAPIPNATTPVLSLTNVDATRVGTYTVVVTSAQNTATSDPATLTLSTTATRLANISTRGVTTGGANVLIGGFVVTGTGNQTRQMLIRVVGPTLSQLGVSGFLNNPRLELYNSTSPTPIQQNDNWASQTGGAIAVQAIQQATNRAGAFNLPNNSNDAVILATLTPGNYTVQAKGPVANPDASGVVLVEVYDVTLGAAAGPKAANVSTRGEVGTGGNILIAGFVVNGGVSRRMLIRGVGPTLRAFGLGPNAILTDPTLTLIEQSSGRTIATNDDWAAGEDAAIIASAATAAGAFPLANGSKDSALIVMLPPGAYTVQLRGVNNTTGIGIVEVYDVDP